MKKIIFFGFLALSIALVSFLAIKDKYRVSSEQRQVKLILHAGLEKTGTSAIQNFLANNVKELQAQGILYPNVDEQQKRDIPSSGNAAFILKQYEKDPDFFKKIYQEAIKTNSHTVLLSSEIMTLEPDKLYEILKGHPQFDPYVILYVRELYGFAWSYYQQDLKFAEGEYREFDQVIPPLNLDIWLDSEFSKNKLIVVNFDLEKNNLISSFFNKTIVPIDMSDLEEIKTINRSCTESEHNILDYFWKNGQNKLVPRLANAFLLNKPKAANLKYYNQDYAHKVYAHYKNSFEKANEFLIKKYQLTTSEFMPEGYVSQWNQSNIESDDIKIASEVLGMKEKFENSSFKELCPKDFDPYVYLSQHMDLLIQEADPYQHFYENMEK